MSQRTIFIAASSYARARERAWELCLPRSWRYWCGHHISGRGYRDAVLLLDDVGIPIDERLLLESYGWDIRPISEGVPA